MMQFLWLQFDIPFLCPQYNRDSQEGQVGGNLSWRVINIGIIDFFLAWEHHRKHPIRWGPFHQVLSNAI